MSLQLLVILVPVLFGLMGFALDLGRLYLVRTELNQAANALALAAAGQLLGTAASLDNAAARVSQAVDSTGGTANTFNFGSLVSGNSAGALSSAAVSAFFASMAEANAEAGNPADGSTARYAQVTLRAEAPLLFWSLLPGGESRRTTVASRAVAGISAPLCTVCGAEPFAVAALDANDADNFGFGDPAAGQLYTFAFECTGAGRIAPIPGTTVVVQYGILNRADVNNSALDEQQQLFRHGAGGLFASSTPNPTGSAVPMQCVAVGDAAEAIWPATSPNACGSATPIGVIKALCGLFTRAPFGTDLPTSCSLNGTDVTPLAAAYFPDTDQNADQTLLYSAYAGNGRRVVTLPVVDALATNVVSTMTVLGFRQFLLMPALDGSPLNPADPNGRFVVQYIGSPAPVSQGFFDDRFQLAGGFCPASGPGKVVLHQ
jgi:Flp pilus assembly protein TadG